MVNNYQQPLDKVFGALSDPTRRAILARLSQGSESVSNLAQPFSSSLPAISKHLTVLEQAGLISRQTIGRQRLCKINHSALSSAAEWLDHYSKFWTTKLDSLEALLNSEKDIS